MTMIRYNIQTGTNGSIMIPTTPFAVGEKIEVVLRMPMAEDHTLDDDWQTPTDEQLEKMYTMCRGVLEGMTREDFDQLREERIMGAKR